MSSKNLQEVQEVQGTYLYTDYRVSQKKVCSFLNGYHLGQEASRDLKILRFRYMFGGRPKIFFDFLGSSAESRFFRKVENFRFFNF